MVMVFFDFRILGRTKDNSAIKKIHISSDHQIRGLSTHSSVGAPRFPAACFEVRCFCSAAWMLLLACCLLLDNWLHCKMEG